MIDVHAGGELVDEDREKAMLNLRGLARSFGFDLVPATDGPAPPCSPRRRRATALAWARAAAIRRQALGAKLAADPAWDMLVAIYISRCEARSISITSAILAAEVSGTTGLRWIAMLEAEGLVVRNDDPADRRRRFLALTTRGAARIEEALDAAVASDRRLGLERIVLAE